MTIEKSAEELLKSSDWDLTEDELEQKRYLQREIQDGVWEPNQITLPDIEVCMNKWGMVCTVDYPTKEEEDILRKILLKNWNSLSESDKVIYHCINGTLPRWGEPRPPSKAFMKYYNEQIDKP